MWILVPVVLLTCGMLTDCANYYANPSSQRNTLFNLDMYDSKVRPYNTTTVNVSFSLVNIKELDVEEQRLSVLGWFTVVWQDPRITWTVTSSSITTLHTVEGELWKPQIVVENGVNGMDIILMKDLMYRIDPDGDVTWEPTSFLQVYCAVDLTYFPFDKHRCGITVSSWSMTHYETPLTPTYSTINLDHYQENSEWKLDPSTEVQSTLTNKEINNEQRVFSRITFYLSLSRRSGAVELVVFLPLWLLSVLSVLTFLLPSEGGEKASYCVVLLLAIVVFLQVAYSYIPLASTTTPVLVVYISFVLILVGLCEVCGIVVLIIHHHESDSSISPTTLSVIRFFQTITLNRTNKDPIPESVIEEEQSPTPKPEKKEMSSRTSLPNGHSWNPIGGKAPLPALDTLLLRRNRVHPKSASSQHSVVTVESKSSAAVQTQFEEPWKVLANSLDRLFLMLFLLLILVTNVTFTIIFMVAG